MQRHLQGPALRPHNWVCKQKGMIGFGAEPASTQCPHGSAKAPLGGVGFFTSLICSGVCTQVSILSSVWHARAFAPRQQVVHREKHACSGSKGVGRSSARSASGMSNAPSLRLTCSEGA